VADSSNVSNIVKATNDQRAYWVCAANAEQKDPGALSVKFGFAGFIDQALLEEAWTATVSRYQMLRASLNPGPRGQILLVVRSVSPSIIKFHDSDSNTEPVSIGLSDITCHQLHCDYADEKQVELTWYCHHALVDGWSALIVIQDFLNIYNAKVAQKAIPAKPEQDYLDTLQIFKKVDSTETRDYWRAYLRKLNHPSLLCHTASGVVKNQNKVAERVLAESDRILQLGELATEHGVTVYSILQLAWALIISNMIGRDDLAIGIAASGRNPDIPNIDKVVGPLSTVSPMRIKIDNNCTVAQLVGAIQENSFRCIEHQHIGLMDILELAEPACQHRLFDALLVLENLPIPELSGEIDLLSESNKECDSIQKTGTDKTVSLSYFHSGIVSQYPLTLTVVLDKQWRLRVDFDDERFSEQWVDQVLNAFESTLNTIASHWTKPVSLVKDNLNLVCPAHPDSRAIDLPNTPDRFKDDLIHEIVGPTNKVELDMLVLWEDLLQVRPISMTDHFFDIGGNSLLALKLVDQIEKRFDLPFDISIFFTNPSPRDCVEKLEDTTTGEVPIPCVLPLSNGNRPALFCLHAGGGHAMFYRDFANLLHADIPCYAIQPKGIDGRETPINNIPQMAAHYIEEIRRVQARGPYHLLCYCFGGALILEMSKQLRNDGHEIGCLLVADAPSPVPARHPMAKFGWKAYLLYEYIVQKRFDYFWQVSFTQIQKLRHKFKSLQPAATTDNALRHVEIVQQACEQSFCHYRALKCDHNIQFLNAENTDKRFSNSVYMRNWKTLAPNQKNYTINGDHRLIFNRPYVQDTASLVSDILSEYDCHEKAS